MRRKTEYAKLGGAWLSRPIKRSDIFYINWREPDAPANKSPSRKTTGTADEAKAEAALADWVVRNRGPQHVGDPQLGLQVGPIVQWYYDTYASTLSGAAAQRYNCANIIEFFGADPVSALTKDRQEKFMQARADAGVRGGTINKDLTSLRAALNRAHERGVLKERPPKIFAIPQADLDEQEADVFTEEQLRDLLRRCASHEYLYRLVLIMLCTGCRPEAAKDLTPRQIDLEHGLIHLNPPGRVQNNKRRPVVRLLPTMRPYLEQWMDGLDRTTPFVNIKGRKIKRIDNLWNRIVRGDMDLQGRYILYSLRHTVGTLLNAAGVDASQISMLLGHTRQDVGRMTSRYMREHFAHIRPEYLREVSAALDTIVARALTPSASDNIVPLRRESAA